VAVKFLLLLSLCALCCACKAKAGAVCKVTSDCAEALTCATWDDAHDDVIGECADDKCCVTKANAKKAKKHRLHAQCDAFIKTVDDSRDALQLPRKTPPSLTKLAQALDAFVDDCDDVKLRDKKLDGFRDDYTALAKKLAASARKKAKAVNLFDGKIVFGEAKVMSRIDARESTLVAQLNDHCEGSKGGALSVVFPETGGETRKR
jgi:hypothetical protein